MIQKHRIAIMLLLTELSLRGEQPAHQSSVVSTIVKEMKELYENVESFFQPKEMTKSEVYPNN